MDNQAIIEKYLTDDEAILWSGTPNHLSLFNPYDFLLIPLTAGFGGLLILYSVLAAGSMFAGQGTGAVLFPLVGILFLLIGLYLIVGRIWYRKKRLERNIYVLTNKRAIVINHLREEKMTVRRKSDFQISTRKHQILFENKNIAADLFYGLGLDIFFRIKLEETFGFYGIAEPDVILRHLNFNKR